MSTNTALTFLLRALPVLALATFLALPAAATEMLCTAIPATRLKITASEHEGREKIIWKSRVPGGSIQIDDPATADVKIELLDADGLVLSANLPAGSDGWQSRGTPASSWTYSSRLDPQQSEGVQRIKTQDSQIDFRGKGVDLNEIRAPLPLPLTMRLTSGSRCYEAVFEGCTKNESGRILCKESCTPVDLSSTAGADRTIVLDLANSQPWEDRFRSFNLGITSLTASAGGRTRGLELLDRVFSERSGRNIRMKYDASAGWPNFGFNQQCEWQNGQQTAVDQIVQTLAATGANIEFRLMGQPASLSSACNADGTCNDRMVPGGACQCSGSGNRFARYIPHAYNAEFRAHWRCVLHRYAALGVKRFEVWNEPDGADFFRGDAALEGQPGWAASLEGDFLELFEQMRVVLEEARAELPAKLRDTIEIGGPAMSSVRGTIGSAATPSLPVVLADTAAGPGEANLDFISAHFYAGEPGLPFADGRIAEMRSWVPSSWPAPRLEINEWNTGLGHNHPCDDADGNPNNGWQAPETGRSPNSAEGCDHRGAGYTAFMLAGFATSGADVMPYVFEPFANGGSERCDMLENSLGLFTRHGLPKSTAAVHWAIDQMGWRLLGAEQDLIGDRSIGWIAAQSEDQVVHLLIGQHDSDEGDIFGRAYALAGHQGTDLFSACGCNDSACIRSKLTAAFNAANPADELQVLCSGISPSEAADAIAAAQLGLQRAPHKGTEVDLGLEIRDLSCQRRFEIEVFRVGPGESTADLWRAMEGPHRTAATCDGILGAVIDAYEYDWPAIQDTLWDRIRTPHETYRIRAGDPLPQLKLPAYGSLYVRIR